MLHRRERTQSPRGGDRHVRMAPSAIISPSEADVEEITRLNITDSKDSPSVSTLGSPANGYDGSSQSGVPLGGQGEDTTMAMAGGATTWTHSTTGTHDEPEAQQQHLLGTSNPQREPNVVGALSSTPGYKRQRLTRMQRKTALGINVSINIEHGVPLSGKIVIIQEIDQYRGLTWIAWVLHLLSSTAIFLASYMWFGPLTAFLITAVVLYHLFARRQWFVWISCYAEISVIWITIMGLLHATGYCDERPFLWSAASKSVGILWLSTVGYLNAHRHFYTFYHQEYRKIRTTMRVLKEHMRRSSVLTDEESSGTEDAGRTSSASSIRSSASSLRPQGTSRITQARKLDRALSGESLNTSSVAHGAAKPVRDEEQLAAVDAPGNNRSSLASTISSTSTRSTSLLAMQGALEPSSFDTRSTTSSMGCSSNGSKNSFVVEGGIIQSVLRMGGKVENKESEAANPQEVDSGVDGTTSSGTELRKRKKTAALFKTGDERTTGIGSAKSSPPALPGTTTSSPIGDSCRGEIISAGQQEDDVRDSRASRPSTSSANKGSGASQQFREMEASIQQLSQRAQEQREIFEKQARDLISSVRRCAQFFEKNLRSVFWYPYLTDLLGQVSFPRPQEPVVFKFEGEDLHEMSRMKRKLRHLDDRIYVGGYYAEYILSALVPSRVYNSKPLRRYLVVIMDLILPACFLMAACRHFYVFIMHRVKFFGRLETDPVVILIREIDTALNPYFFLEGYIPVWLTDLNHLLFSRLLEVCNWILHMIWLFVIPMDEFLTYLRARWNSMRSFLLPFKTLLFDPLLQLVYVLHDLSMQFLPSQGSFPEVATVVSYIFEIMQTKLFWGVPVSGRSLGWWRWVSDSFLIVYEYSGLQMVVDRFIVPLFVKKKDPEEEEEENRRKQKSVEADMRSMDAGLEQQRVQEVERLHEEETEDSADTSTDMTHFRNSRDDILAAADHHEEHLLSSSSGKGNNVQHLPSPTSGAAPGPASAGLYNGESGDWGKESGVGEDTHLLVEAAQETTYKNDKKMNQHEDHIIIRGPPPDRPSVSSTSTFGQSPPGICAVFDIEADSSSSDPSPTGEKGRRKQEQEKVADEDGQGLLSTTAPEGGHDLGGGGDQQTVVLAGAGAANSASFSSRGTANSASFSSRSSSSSASSAAVHDHFGTHGGDRMGKHQSTRPFGLHPVSSSSSLSSTSSASEQPVRGDPTDANEGDPDRSHHHGLSHTSSLSSNYSGRGVGAGVSLTSSNGGSMTMNGNCGTTSRGSDAARAMRSSRCVMSTVIGSIHIAPSSTLTISTSTPPQPQAPSQAHPPVVSTSTPPQPQAPSQAHPPVVVPPLKLDTLNQKKNIPLLSKEEESLNADLVHDDNQGGGEAEEEDLNHGMRLGGGFVPTPLSTPASVERSGENTAAVGDVGSSSSSSNHGNPVTSITVDQSTTSTPTRGGPLVGSAPASTNEDDIGSSAAANNVELQPESIIPEEEIEVAAVAAGAADPTSDTGQQGTRHRPSPQKNKNKRKKK